MLTYLGKAIVNRYCKFGLVNVSDSQTSLRRILKQQFRNMIQKHILEMKTRNLPRELCLRNVFGAPILETNLGSMKYTVKVIWERLLDTFIQ